MKWIVLILLVLLAACAEPAPESGYVRKKDFTPAHWEDGYTYTTENRYSCENEHTWEGKYEVVCRDRPETISHYVEHYAWVDDRFRLYLENCDNPKKCKKGWRTVAESEYNRYDVGRHYPEGR